MHVWRTGIYGVHFNKWGHLKWEMQYLVNGTMAWSLDQGSLLTDLWKDPRTLLKNVTPFQQKPCALPQPLPVPYRKCPNMQCELSEDLSLTLARD